MEEDKKDNLDLSKILLPKKEGPSVDSAQRVNAGALLAQEQKAGAEGAPQVPAPPTPEVSAEAPATPVAKKEESQVRPLQTYQHDIESLVEKKDVSVLSIAAAEQNRKRSTPPPAAAVPLGWRALYWGGGALLIVIALGVGLYLYSRPTTVPGVPLNTAAPFITVDDTKTVEVPLSTREVLMSTVDGARRSVSLSLGLVERLFVAVPSQDPSGNPTLGEMRITDLLRVLSPYVPEQLLRTLSGKYLLGVHSYDENQAFLILQPDSYEVAYAAMLEWERTMRQDLLPLFSRTPPVRANDTATTTATPAVLPSIFADRVVENTDARVIQNEYGDIVLLWTFLDRNTIVVTTNEATLREIISRRTSSPSLNLPQ